MIMSDGVTINVEDLPASLTRGASSSSTSGATIVQGNAPMTLREMEMQMIYSVLEKHQGDKPKTARELGIALKTLYNKLNQDQARSAAG